jgi:hypothetical protein
LVPGLTLAGPNEGGTLILHANPGLVFTSDIQNYCGMSALDSCSAAVTSVPWDPGRRIVFHAIAAFPAGSSPRLKVLSFGIDYDPTKFVMAARGTCADFEIPGVGWLAPGTGTSQSWTTGTRTALLTEAYWFAGYEYSEQEGEDSTSVALIPHPVQHGVFVDDAFPSEVDTIAAYGRLGIGRAGSVPCCGEGDVAVGQGENEGQDEPGAPSSPDSPPADPVVGTFVDTDTTTAVSTTTTIGPGCELVLEDHGVARHYGPGEQVVLDIHHGFATVNGVTVYQPPSEPMADLPLIGLVRAFRGVPMVQTYVSSHRGDSLRVWNDAALAYGAAVESLSARARVLHRTLRRAGIVPEEVALRLRRHYSSSPIIREADVTVLGGPSEPISVTFRPYGTEAEIGLVLSDRSPGPHYAPSHVLTTLRSTELQRALQSLTGTNGPAFQRICFSSVSSQRP